MLLVPMGVEFRSIRSSWSGVKGYVAAILPRTVWDCNDLAHRRLHDTTGSAPKSDPHLTLGDCFIAYDRFAQAEELLQRALARIAPVRVQFICARYWSHARPHRYTVYFDIDSESKHAVLQLQRVVASVTRQFLRVTHYVESQTSPHVSVCKKSSREEASLYVDQLNACFVPFTFELEEVHILSRDGLDPHYVVRKSLKLGRASPSVAPWCFTPIALPYTEEHSRSAYFTHTCLELDATALHDAFSAWHVRNIQLTLDNVGRCRGWGYVLFGSVEALLHAMDTSITVRTPLGRETLTLIRFT